MTKLCMVRRDQSDQNRRITRVKSSTRQKLHYLCKDEDLFDVNNIKKKMYIASMSVCGNRYSAAGACKLGAVFLNNKQPTGDCIEQIKEIFRCQTM